ncbi:MAG: M23 family metallopeptidase [Myxococcota bacterium]|nr:M23 family metallopeptidase [Myxococcota bacterium]
MPEARDEVQHRPLPSVDIPLLRDDVRSTRLKRAVALGVLGVAAIAGLIALFVYPGLSSDDAEAPEEAQTADAPPEPGSWAETAEAVAPEAMDEAAGPDEPETPEAAAAPPPTEELEGGATRTVRQFGEARGFRPALVNAGCTGEEADALIAALGEVMDFRRCRPSHEMVFVRNEDGTLRRFTYNASITQIYEASRDDEGTLVGRQVPIPIERVRIRRGGTIRSSLGSALERVGLGRTLVGVFVETFAREVNFNTHTRAGDTFRIIVEEERVAGELLRYGTVHALEVNGQRLGHHQAFWFEPSEGDGDFFDESGRAVHGGWLRTPLRYDHISSPFDPRRMHPILRRIHPHNGVDYAASTGTPVWAAADGTITVIGPRGANGNLVSIRHANGYETHYAHLSRFASGLEQGDTVEQRQVIGYVGSTGRSTGPHLHFGLKRHGRFIDPQAELNGPGRMMASAHLGRYRRRVRELQRELAQIAVAPAPEGEDEPEPESAPSD